MIPELVTERLRLRGWLERDRAPYAALNADPEVMRHFPATLTPRQSDEMVDRMQSGLSDRGFGLWATERIDTGEFIGFIGVAVPTWHADRITPCVEIGWRLARQHWGNGFAPEGATAVLALAFERIDLPHDEVVSFTTEKNLKSQRVMQKIGLRRDAARDFDHPMTPGWEGARHVVYAIDRPGWEAGVAR